MHISISLLTRTALCAALAFNTFACSGDDDHGPPIGTPGPVGPIVVSDGGSTSNGGSGGTGSPIGGSGGDDVGQAGTFGVGGSGTAGNGFGQAGSSNLGNAGAFNTTGGSAF